MKKGFTLVEIIAVIAIIAILSFIVMPLVLKNLEDSRKKAYQTMVNSFETSAELYVNNNREDFVLINEDDYYNITLQTLVDNGYLKLPLKNPKTSKDISLSTYVVVRFNNDMILEYKYEE